MIYCWILRISIPHTLILLERTNEYRNTSFICIASCLRTDHSYYPQNLRDSHKMIFPKNKTHTHTQNRRREEKRDNFSSAYWIFDQFCSQMHSHIIIFTSKWMCTLIQNWVKHDMFACTDDLIVISGRMHMTFENEFTDKMARNGHSTFSI